MFAIPHLIRKPFGRALAGIAILWLAACEPVQMVQTGGGGAPPARDEVPVALLVPHGTSNEQEQQLARDLENAARMAVADLSGVDIDLRVYGTAGDTSQAREAAINAADDGARIIIGPLHAESANAVGVAMASRDINVLTFSNNSTIAGGNLFVLGQTFENTADRLAGYAVGQGTSRIVAVHSDNLAGRLGRAAIETGLRNNGGTLAGSVAYDFSQEGVLDAVPDIRDMVEIESADAIFLTANAAGALPLFSQMLPENGLGSDRLQYIGLSRWDTPPQTLQLSGVQGGWFAMPDPNRSARFESRFRSANGNTPHPLAGLAYDGIAAVGALVQAGQGLGRGDLTQSAGFKGVNGVFRLRLDGTNERSLAVATITDEQVEILSPAPQSFGGAGF
jgi:hypothetical protein